MAPEIRGVLCNLADSKCRSENCPAVQEGLNLGDTSPDRIRFMGRAAPIFDENGSRPVESDCRIAGEDAWPLLVYPEDSLRK